MTRRLRIVLAAAAALVLGLSGQSMAQQKVKIGQATSSLSFLPVWSARALDSFKAQGLDLEWAAVPGGDPNALAALDAGDLDFVAVGSETPLQAISKGQPFQFIMPLMDKVSLQLVVSEDFLKRKGVSPADPLPKRLAALKGATLGVSAIKGAQDRAGRWLIAQGGLDPAKALNVAMVGPPPALRAALQNKQIDAFMLSPPEGAIADQEGFGKVLVDLADAFPKLKQQPFLVLVAKKPMDAAKKALAVKTVKALLAANAATVKDPKGTADAIQGKFFAKVKPAVVETAVKSMTDGIATPHFTTTGIANVIEFAAATGTKFDKTLDAKTGENDFWTNAIIDAAKK
jgi:ABC-type nitrate/sulfonate/bicarbonate transport system substrate-binding protein